MSNNESKTPSNKRPPFGEKDARVAFDSDKDTRLAVSLAKSVKGLTADQREDLRAVLKIAMTRVRLDAERKHATDIRHLAKLYISQMF